MQTMIFKGLSICEGLPICNVPYKEGTPFPTFVVEIFFLGLHCGWRWSHGTSDEKRGRLSSFNCRSCGRGSFFLGGGGGGALGLFLLHFRNPRLFSFAISHSIWKTTHCSNGISFIILKTYFDSRCAAGTLFTDEVGRSKRDWLCLASSEKITIQAVARLGIVLSGIHCPRMCYNTTIDGEEIGKLWCLSGNFFFHHNFLHYFICKFWVFAAAKFSGVKQVDETLWVSAKKWVYTNGSPALSFFKFSRTFKFRRPFRPVPFFGAVIPLRIIKSTTLLELISVCHVLVKRDFLENRRIDQTWLCRVRMWLRQTGRRSIIRTGE